MSINFEKSNFDLEEIEYLGFVLNGHGIKASISEITTLKIRTPRTLKQLERLIDFFNWYSPFVYNLSGKLIPLYNKLSKSNEKLIMTEKDQKNN